MKVFHRSVHEDAENVWRHPPQGEVHPRLRRLDKRIKAKEEKEKKERERQALKAATKKVRGERRKPTSEALFLKKICRGEAPDPLPPGYASAPEWDELHARTFVETGLATWSNESGWMPTEKGWEVLTWFFSTTDVSRWRSKFLEESAWTVDLVPKTHFKKHDECRVCGRPTWSGKPEVDERRRYCSFHGPRQLGRRRLALPEIEDVKKRR